MMITDLIDLDDTLTPNLRDYSYAQLAFIERVIEKLGPRAPDVQAIINTEVRIDKGLVKELGFYSVRFPTSFVMAYEEFCRPLGIIPSKEDLDEMYELGMLAFSKERYVKNGLFEGVPETLDYLLAKGHELILLTKGDPIVQHMKFEALGLGRWFGDNKYVVPTKNPDIIRKLIGDRPPNKVWHIGNSVRSDVNPALEAGIKMIYVPLETWAWEKDHEGIPMDDNLIVLDNFSDIVKNYEFIYEQ